MGVHTGASYRMRLNDPCSGIIRPVVKLLCPLVLTKFSTTTETVKWSSWVIPTDTQQIQDSGRPPFEKKTVKSPYLFDRSANFDEIWQVTHTGPLQRINS